MYGYFRSKEAILDEVLQQRTALAIATYFTGINAGASFIDKIEAALVVFAEFIQANRSILLATFQVSTRRGLEPEEAPAQWIFVALCQMLEAGIAAGEIRELPVDATARTIIGAHLMGVLGIAIFNGRRGDPTLPPDLRHMIRLLLEK